jgi:hypothetical protein
MYILHAYRDTALTLSLMALGRKLILLPEV